MDFEEFIKDIKKQNIIILGELHGTAEIPQHMLKIISGLSDSFHTIFLEIPVSQQKYIDSYFISKDESLLQEIPFFKEPSMDGRGSQEYLLFIASLKKMKKRVLCFDPSEPTQRDYKMYLNIVKSKIQRCIIVTGNVHACKQILKLQGEDIKPLANYLAEKFGPVISVNLSAIAGMYYNMEVKNILGKTSLKEGIFPTSENYDFLYLLKKVSPCHFIK